VTDIEKHTSFTGIAGAYPNRPRMNLHSKGRFLALPSNRMNDIDERTSLLFYGINNGRKKGMAREH
jgi:hypothetical protein